MDRCILRQAPSGPVEVDRQNLPIGPLFIEFAFEVERFRPIIFPFTHGI